MNKIIVLSAIGMLAVLAGCQKNKPATAPSGSAVTNLAPPPQPQPYQPAPTYQNPPVTSIQTPPQDPIPAEPPVTSAGKTYKVKSGDTLWAIASRTYGDGKQWKKIAAANNIKGDRVYVGQTLTLP